MILGALAEGLGILALVPLLSVVAGSSERLPFSNDTAALLGQSGILGMVLLLFFLAMAFRAWLLQQRDVATARLEANYEAALKLRTMATVAAHGWGKAAQLGQAGAQSLIADAIPRTSSAIHFGLAASTATALIVVQLAVSAVLSPFLALTAAAALLIFIPTTIRLTQRSKTFGQVTLDYQEDSARSGFTLYAGLKAALAQGAVGSFLGDYHVRLGRVASHFVSYSEMMARSRTRHSLSASLGAVSVVAIGYGLLKLDLPKLLVILVLFSRMSGLAQLLQQSAANFFAYSVAFDLIQQRVGLLISRVSIDNSRPPPLHWDSFALEGVRYRHQGSSFEIGPISVRVERGNWIAITGGSGAGKSTLVDLISGLIDATHGRMLVDGRPLDSEKMIGWRAGLAYVGQQEWVGETTLRAALGEASESEIWSVLQIVGLAHVVASWPLAIDTELADRGARLSGGERQRLLIARALLRQPRLLILDEATAALDVAAEEALVKRVRRERTDVAVIMVAHRVETTLMCDKILSIST
jgi:ATP-binding cassette subfamily C protein